MKIIDILNKIANYETDRNNPTISPEELQAINKQVEELRWY